MSTIEKEKGKLTESLQQTEHYSLYLFPFTRKCQVSKWTATNEEYSFAGRLREFLAISADALLSVWVGNTMAYTGLLPRLSNLSHGFKRGTNLVLESNEAFNRTIYHLHQELEFTVSVEKAFEEAQKFVELYESMYFESSLPYTLFELRFTPADHKQTLLGAGRERASCWIDLVSNDSNGFERYYAAAEDLVKEIGGRMHLGKYCRGFEKQDMLDMHGENFEKFLALRDKYDGSRKFENRFTRRLFG